MYVGKEGRVGGGIQIREGRGKGKSTETDSAGGEERTVGMGRV